MEGKREQQEGGDEEEQGGKGAGGREYEGEREGEGEGEVRSSNSSSSSSSSNVAAGLAISSFPEGRASVGVKVRRPAPQETESGGSSGASLAGPPGSQWLERALSLVDALPRLFETEPTSFVYASLMEACLKQGQVARCEDLWRRMLQQGVLPDVATWRVRARALGAQGLVPGRARVIVEEAAAVGAETDYQFL
eukprot:jgi/Mesen1/1902/ME000143S00953